MNPQRVTCMRPTFMVTSWSGIETAWLRQRGRNIRSAPATFITVPRIEAHGYPKTARLKSVGKQEDRPEAYHGLCLAGRLGYCLDQHMRLKRLRQIGDTPGRRRLPARLLIVVGGHEDDGNRAAGERQLAPQLQSGRATQMDVEDQAVG